jgi:formate hydrogenlyase subunit 3/multisubunit Na+/H+ antiporter MnhD subunit
MKALRVVAAQISTVVLAFLLLLVVALQCRDFQSATEVVPLTSFAVFLSVSAFAIGWSRVNPPNASLSEQRRVKQAGVDLFLATGLTLASAGLLRIAQDALLKSTPMATPILILHALCLALGFFIGWVAFCSLLRQAAIPAAAPQLEH